jgi:hypothetical protein
MLLYSEYDEETAMSFPEKAVIAVGDEWCFVETLS